jgi:hypothetical protein
MHLGILSLVAVALISALLWSNSSMRKAIAASPASGAIAPTGPVLPFTGTWNGTATGTGANAHESDCVEGVNCDTFRLTVAPGDYSGKFINTKIDWTVPANDYDLYIHKCPTPASTAAQCNATEPTGQSTAGAPQTSESSSIDPANTGVGDYIRVVYKFAASDYIEVVVYQD